MLVAALPTAAIDPALARILSLIAMVVLLVGGLIAFYRLKREEREDAPLTDEELLAQFEAAHRAGEMDDAEYRRVRDHLKRRIAPAAAPPRPPVEHEAPAPAHEESALPPEAG